MGHFIRILEELHRSIDAICGEKPCDVGADPERLEEAVRFMALCMGGINISRSSLYFSQVFVFTSKFKLAPPTRMRLEGLKLLITL